MPKTKTKTNAPAATLNLHDPEWPAKRAALLDRLANTPPGDALLTGVLGMLDQALLDQLLQCENAKVTETEAVSLVGRIGLLIGLRGDLEVKWKEQLRKKVEAETKK